MAAGRIRKSCVCYGCRTPLEGPVERWRGGAETHCKTNSETISNETSTTTGFMFKFFENITKTTKEIE